MTFGFIGTGNMGGALARALRGRVDGGSVLLANRGAEKAEALARELGCRVSSNAEVAESADFIFLGVKPRIFPEVLSGIAPALAKREGRFVLVTMAAGLTISRVRKLAGGEYPVIRIMPNTPCAVGEGVIIYACGGVTQAEERAFLDAMGGAGSLSPLPEELIDAGSAIAGCGPAFVDLFIEALADGGVACGLPRAAALEYAARMVKGAAALVLESGRHPAELKDAVCSPGGTTIQGVLALERAGFRAAVASAVTAAYEKTASLG